MNLVAPTSDITLLSSLGSVGGMKAVDESLELSFSSWRDQYIYGLISHSSNTVRTGVFPLRNQPKQGCCESAPEWGLGWAVSQGAAEQLEAPPLGRSSRPPPRWWWSPGWVWEWSGDWPEDWSRCCCSASAGDSSSNWELWENKNHVTEQRTDFFCLLKSPACYGILCTCQRHWPLCSSKIHTHKYEHYVIYIWIFYLHILWKFIVQETVYLINDDRLDDSLFT